ncbi:MAG: CHAT domain-containing protein, partial [Acidobacteria bacterium]|nr:CHAT domain-containing protein [Acidobacteriota bacterium]
DGKQWSDKTYYVALILTPETTTAPRFVVLGEASQLEGAALTSYRALVSPNGSTEARTLYQAFWQPLERALGKAKRVYLSPDGVLNLIGWNVIPAGKRLLVERYDIRLVSSTKDLLRERRPAASQTAVLVGHPQFDLREDQQRAVVRSLQTTEEEKTLVALVRGSRSRDQQGQTLPSLPGAKMELDAVETLLEKRGWQVERFSGATALEEAVKQVRQPRLLHLATHGFFLADQEAAGRVRSGEAPSGREDPMLRSGLYLAGAERALAGQPLPADLDDGILTAYEASGLSLQGTELVVLSACETGLGEVKNGEGVFGLRRALQVAGAEAVLMSLWEVPDRETQELMALFYQKWLAGQSKPEALRKAQQELRARVKKRYGRDLPYYWGAFVLVGAEPRP